jgi:hypothetical protein
MMFEMTRGSAEVAQTPPEFHIDIAKSVADTVHLSLPRHQATCSISVNGMYGPGRTCRGADTEPFPGWTQAGPFPQIDGKLSHGALD